MGSRLRQLRKQHKLTQKQVAERTGLAVSAISSYESGSRCPTYDTLRKFATMYHVSCDYLVGAGSLCRQGLLRQNGRRCDVQPVFHKRCSGNGT